MRVSCLAGSVAGMFLLGLSVRAGAAEDPTFDPSLASSLVQSKAQARIFSVDDAADAACKSRKFTAVEVVAAPAVRQLGPKVIERKWQEQWTVDRCGQPIGYRMFFTDMGDGGAFFSYIPLPTVRMDEAAAPATPK